MALGLNLGGNGGSITPICKWDSRSGRMFIINRQDGQDEQVEVTDRFRAVMDLENIEVGSIAFVAGMAPDFHVVKFGEKVPAPPTENHKPGCRVLVKLAKDLGGDIREIASNAKSFLKGIDELHTAYLTGAKANPGKLPVVKLNKSVAIISGEGARKSTNYSPSFEITAWVDRPTDLVYSPKTPSIAAAANAGGPPSTGSTPLAAPMPMVAGDDDFG